MTVDEVRLPEPTYRVSYDVDDGTWTENTRKSAYEEWHSRQWEHLGDMERQVYRLKSLTNVIGSSIENQFLSVDHEDICGAMLLLSDEVAKLTEIVNGAYELAREVGIVVAQERTAALNQQEKLGKKKKKKKK